MHVTVLLVRRKILFSCFRCVCLRERVSSLVFKDAYVICCVFQTKNICTEMYRIIQCVSGCNEAMNMFQVPCACVWVIVQGSRRSFNSKSCNLRVCRIMHKCLIEFVE